MQCVPLKQTTKIKKCLTKNYASPDLDKRVLGDVVDLFTNMDMGETEGNRDVLGRTYEYCIAQFAEKKEKVEENSIRHQVL